MAWRRVAGIGLVGSGIGLVLSVFLPWLVTINEVGSVLNDGSVLPANGPPAIVAGTSVASSEMSQSLIAAVVILALGMVAVLLGAIAMVRVRRDVAFLGGLCALMAGVVTASAVFQILQDHPSANFGGYVYSLGFGVWLGIVAAGLGIVSSVALFILAGARYTLAR